MTASMIRHLYRNLMWASDGSVWAIWRVFPPQYRNTPVRAQREVLARTEALLRALPAGEALLISLCPRTDPASLMAAMRSDVDLATAPDWADSLDAYGRMLDGFELTSRTHWLAIRLPSLAAGWRESIAAGLGQVATGFGVAAARVPARQVDAYERVAARIAGGLPTSWLRPAEVSEVLWMFRRAPRRGVDEPPLTREVPGAARGGSQVVDEELRGPTLIGLDQVHLDEGGKNGRRLTAPFARRFLQVTAAGHEPSYQAFSVLSEMPGEFTFPGSEFLEHLDDFPFPVEWAVRLNLVPRDKAEAATRRRARELAEQVHQRGDDRGGMPSDLEQALADTDDYQARLATSASEVELRAGVVFCVYDADPDLAQEQAEILRKEYAPSDYGLVRPIGAQADLYRAMQPGTPTPRLLRVDYAQYLLAGGFAMSIPFAHTALGDPVGGLLGVRTDSSGTAPVLHDPSYPPRALHASASVGFVGRLGAGKSVTQKIILDMIVRRGGLGLVVDRTPSREWPRFAQVLPGRTRVVDVSPAAEFSLDPLRLFSPDAAQRYCEGFLALLLGVEGLSGEGAVVSECVEDVLTGTEPSMARLVEVLSRHDDPRAGDLGRRLNAARRLDLARVILDPALPALHTGQVDTLVFSTAGIALPDREELASETHMRQLAPEKRLGRAVMYLVAAAAREIAFDTTRYAGVFLDECYWLTSSAEGERLALELVRDGRKHNCGAYFGAHDPADLGGGIISGLLGQKFLLHHSDIALAKRGLEWIGLDPDDEDMVRLVRELSPPDDPDRAGETLYRDAADRVAPMKVLIPDLPGVAAAIGTDPGTADNTGHGTRTPAETRPDRAPVLSTGGDSA